MKLILIYLVFLAVCITFFTTVSEDDEPVETETWQIADTVFVSNGIDTLRLDVSKLKQP